MQSGTAKAPARERDGRDIEPMLTVKDVQELSRLGRTTIAEAMARGDLPVRRFGRAVRFRASDVHAWLHGGEDEAA